MDNKPTASTENVKLKVHVYINHSLICLKCFYLLFWLTGLKSILPHYH